VYAAGLGGRATPADRQIAIAAREVVLAAGAFNTPQLLQLSGVGDGATLARLGIEQRLERPGVGRNLQDRVEAAVVSALDRPIDLVKDCRLGEEADPCLDAWRDGHGVYQTSGFLASVLRRSPGASQADLQVFAAPGDARGYYPGYARDALAHKDRYSWLLLKAHTHNQDGLVELVDASPFSRPRIHFHSYDEADPLHDPDLRALVDGVKFVRKALLASTDVSVREIWPGPAVKSDEALAAFLRKESWGHHACCSAKLGRVDDPLAVVDARLRVIGARGLRIVDASVFPEIPGTFIAMPLYLLAERAADFMLEELR
jgi:choline dehydrogenase